MTRSQFKKMKARNFNMARLETMAHKIDLELFPNPRLRSAAHSLAVRKAMSYTALALAFNSGIAQVNK